MMNHPQNMDIAKINASGPQTIQPSSGGQARNYQTSHVSDVLKTGSGQPYSPNERRHLITGANNASGGGIGVSYSSVVLAGGIKQGQESGQFVAKRDADFQDPRFVNKASSAMNRSPYQGKSRVANLNPAMGNPAQKYDYNILNGQ